MITSIAQCVYLHTEVWGLGLLSLRYNLLLQHHTVLRCYVVRVVRYGRGHEGMCAFKNRSSCVSVPNVMPHQTPSLRPLSSPLPFPPFPPSLPSSPLLFLTGTLQHYHVFRTPHVTKTLQPCFCHFRI